MSQTLYNLSLNDSNDEFLEKISEHTVWILFGLLGKINTIYSTESQIFFNFNQWDDPNEFRFYFSTGIHEWLMYLFVMHAYHSEPVIADRQKMLSHTSGQQVLLDVSESVAEDRDVLFYEGNAAKFRFMMVNF